MTGASRVSEAELHAFVDGQLSDERSLAVAVFLAEHPRDGLRVDGWRGQNEAIQRAFPPPARERVTLAFRAPESDAPLTLPPAPTIDAYRAKRRRRYTVSLAFAFTAGAAAAAAMAISLQRLTPQPAPRGAIIAELAPAQDDLARRAVEAWRTYARDPARPVEVEAKDLAGLTRWLKERTGLERPPLLAEGTLVGGRVLPARDGAAAFLLYRLASGELVGLLAEAGAAGAGAYSASGVTARAWSREGFDYALAGALPERRLDAIAAQLGRNP